MINDMQITVEQTPGRISANFDEIREALEIQMTAYTSLEVTEKNIPESRKDLATLRKIRKAVDNQRKAVKRDFQKPFDEFEANVKSLLAVIDEPIALIDGKLKEFERKRIEEKQAHLHELYEQNIGAYAAYLPYHTVASDRWNNASIKDSEIASDISEQVMRVRADIDAIKALRSEIEPELLEAYRRSGNQLTAAVRKNSDYLEVKEFKEFAEKKAAERAEREALEKAEREALERAAQEVQERAAQETKEAHDSFPATESMDSAETESFRIPDPELTVRVRGTEAIEQLRTFLEFSGIAYEEV